jgi:hypothetical protein
MYVKSRLVVRYQFFYANVRHARPKPLIYCTYMHTPHSPPRRISCMSGRNVLPRVLPTLPTMCKSRHSRYTPPRSTCCIALAAVRAPQTLELPKGSAHTPPRICRPGRRHLARVQQGSSLYEGQRGPHGNACQAQAPVLLGLAVLEL